MKNYQQFEFVADMGMAYACADLVLSRAGAGTVFELLALKKDQFSGRLELFLRTRMGRKVRKMYRKNRGPWPRSQEEMEKWLWEGGGNCHCFHIHFLFRHLVLNG